MTVQTHGFQAEAKQLLQLMISSLYSNKEIFLRELISNASDAIDRLRFESLTDAELIADDADFNIRIEFDKDAKTLTVTDNGIGMTRQEVIDNLGTIAKSGTAEFLNRLTGDQKKDAALIGQFGVGFYSTFIVASEVDVFTKKAATDQGTKWSSAGEDEFSIDDVDTGRGTRVVLHLKADAEEFADGFRLRNIVRKYSDHIGVPVLMPKEGSSEGEGEDDGGDETVNSAKALWTRSRSQVEDDEYNEFYKHVSHDFEDPVTWSHNRVEGKLEYTSLLYIPRHAPFDLWNRDAPRGLKLYVQRVFIMDEADQFLPLYLRFVRGIIDSSDLPLNVSREILQVDERVQTIKSALTKRVLDMLGKLDAEQYESFWDEFGEVLKEGAGEDFTNREALLKLMRFTSTGSKDDAQRTSLADYTGRMQADQDKIFYLVADNAQAGRQSPHLEVFAKQNIEVLLLTDRVDEWFMSFVNEFDGKQFQDVMRGDLDLSTDEAGKDDDPEDAEEDVDTLAKRIGDVLGDKVASVRRSRRLTESPSCLVLGEQDMGAQMRRIMEASGQTLPDTKPHFEFNPQHALIKSLEDADEERFANLVRILFDQASLADGAPLNEPGDYVRRINTLLVELLSP